MKIAKILTITSSFIFTIFICSLLLSCSESKTKQEDVPKKAASSESFSSFLDFELNSIEDNKIIRLSDNRGKVVLVVFWATWCRACLHEIPELIDLRNTYDPSDLEIIAIALPEDNSKEQLDFFKDKFFKITEKQINYTIVTDDGTVARKYEVRGIPANFVFDRKGVLVTTPKYGKLMDILKEVINE